MKGSTGGLTEGSIVRNILRLALPMMVGNVLQNTFNIVDMIFVGKLGPFAIAAVGMSGVVLGVFASVIMGISAGTVAMVARFIGAKKNLKAENVVMQSLFLGLFCYVAVAIIGYLLASPILKTLGASEDVVLHGVRYIRVMFLGSFTTLSVFALLP